MLFFRKLASIVTLSLLPPPSFGEDTVFDLTKDFPNRGPSPDSEWWQKKLNEKAHRDIRRMLIIDDNEIVMEYQRNNVEDDEVFQMWSLTKPFMLMMMGMVIYDEQYDIDFNTTLGEIFVDDVAWQQIPDQEELDFKKNVTLYELFTFTSGLSTGVPILDAFDPPRTINTWPRVGIIPNDHNIPNVVGLNLSESLLIHAVHPEGKGQWKYLVTSNVLSYVMFEITGMTPLEFATKEVFPFVGINYAEWDTNDDGMNAAFSSLRLTAKDIAKLGTLFKQGGKSSPDKQLVPEEYVEMALSPLQVRTAGPMNTPIYPYPEGFRWAIVTPNPESNVPFTFRAGGFLGQKCSFSPETGRLIVIQRSNTITELLLLQQPGGDAQDSAKFEQMGFNTNFTFEIPPTVSPAPTESPGSGASSFDGVTLFQMVLVVSLPFAMMLL